MPGQHVQATLAQASGLLSQFQDLFRARADELNSQIDELFLKVPSTKASEDYHIWEDTPIARHWPRGDERSWSNFSEFRQNIVNLDWDLGIPWHANDEADDQTGMLVSRVRDGARSFAELPIRVANQIVTASVDVMLLPDASPLAYDGVALFSNADRGGVTGGNVIDAPDVGGVATVDAILDDYYDAKEIFRLIQRPRSGEPFWPEDIVNMDSNFMVVCSPANERRFKEAFGSDLILDTAAVTNPIKASVANLTASQPTVKVWSRLTGDDWYVFLVRGTELKPLVMQEREPLQEHMYGFDNSDRTRDTKEKGLAWDARFGFGIFAWQTAVQIDN